MGITQGVKTRTGTTKGVKPGVWVLHSVKPGEQILPTVLTEENIHSLGFKAKRIDTIQGVQAGEWVLLRI